MHHFERFDRICYLMCVICFTLFLSALVQNRHPPHNGLVTYGLWVCAASIALVLYDQLLRFMATSPCLQPGGCLHKICWLCRDCCIDAGKQGLYIVSILSFAFFIAGVVLAATADLDPGMYFVTFALMRVGNYNEVYLSDDGTQYTTPYSGSHGYGQWFGNALSPKNKN